MDKPDNKTTYTPFPGVEEEVAGRTTTRRITYSLAGQAIALRVQIVAGRTAVYHLHTNQVSMIFRIKLGCPGRM